MQGQFNKFRVKRHVLFRLLRMAYVFASYLYL